ncbi:MAG TPA: C39 family peptidase [Candidatus Mediterraneibacter stercorigallinarum]|uniref:C39 family peptidase n=1 Tax=Candidatus Mediterraneibacter stercorigallinarum TaxID=2838686 RepID=A0A9D2DAF8_9FIRM|nr:C39 family peptidase [Candidatus Mediterraneibacter stercorigallinarum]
MSRHWVEYTDESSRRGYPGGQRKRKRKRRRVGFLRRAAAVLVVIAVIFTLKNVISNYLILTGDGIVWNGELNAVYEQAGDVSDTLRELVENNPETVGFVRNYQEKKDAPPAEDIGEVTAGVIPHLLQWDERWGYQIYGDNMIAVNGCGPTVISMVAAGLTGDNTITPYRVAKFAEENGYYEGEAGTSWSLMTEGAQQFGIYGEEMGLDENGIFSALESGNPIICSVRPGDFTNTGHFIVLVGTEDGKIRVNDPNSVKRSEKLWDYETLYPQINNLWVYTAG